MHSSRMKLEDVLEVIIREASSAGWRSPLFTCDEVGERFSIVDDRVMVVNGILP